MKEFLSTKRVLLDSIVMLIGTAAFTNSRELSLVKTNLQEGIMFMGLMKGALGESTPYPQSTNPESPVIENRADKAAVAYSFDHGGPWDEVAMVKAIRSILQETLDELTVKTQSVLDEEFSKALLGGNDFVNGEVIGKIQFTYTEIKSSLTKAKLWLGMQLNFLKERAEYEQVAGKQPE